MYAAAGGASLASRQARKRQQQNKGKQQQQRQAERNAQNAKRAAEHAKPIVPQSKQFHQLPTNYHREGGGSSAASASGSTLLRPPTKPGHERKLSATPAPSKTLLPIAEGAREMHKSRSMHVVVPRPSSPEPAKILTPFERDLESRQLKIPPHVPPDVLDLELRPLERQCSVTRNLAMEGLPNGLHWESPPAYNDLQGRVLAPCGCLAGECKAPPVGWCRHNKIAMQAALMLRSKQRIAKRRRMRRGRAELPSNVATREIPVFPRYPPESWCAQGKAAWLDRGRRCSVSETAACHRLKQSEAHMRWMKRNRIHDASFGGSSSDDEDFLGLYQQSSAANAILYVGLGTVAIGLVISFVGTGEKGFKTLELRLIGPTLIGCGLLCCLVRILLCFCPSRCAKARRKRQRSKRTPGQSRTAPICAEYDLRPPSNGAKQRPMADGEEDLALSEQCTSLLRHQPHQQSKKRVSIAPSVNTNTTTYTTQCERNPAPHCSRMQQQPLDVPSLDVCSVTSSEENLMTVIEVPKIRPQSEPASSSNGGAGGHRPELLLSPAQLEQ